MTALKFYWTWLQLGRAYWKNRHVWTLMTYLNTLSADPAPPESVGDYMAGWLAARENEEDAA